MHLLTFTSWIYPETHFLLLSRPSRSILHTKQVELALVHCELHEIRSFHKMPKVLTNKTNFKIAFLMEVIFQNDSYFTGTWTYPVRLPIPSMQLLKPVFRCKADNCNTCTKVVNNVLCIEFQKSSSC